MIRRSIAALILGPSLLVASLAWSGFVALRTVLDPDRSREVAEELFDNEEVQAQITANIGRAIIAGLPDGALVTEEQVDEAAASVLADPAVEALIVNALGATHAAFLGEGDAPESLSLAPVAEAVREALVTAVPGAESIVPPAPTLEIALPTERIPDASPLRAFTQRAVPILALLAAVGVVLALLTTSDRPSVLWRAGFWALGAAAFSLIVGLGLPALIRRFAPDGAEVFAALFSALLRSVVLPAVVLAVGGVVMLVVASASGAVGSRVGRQRAASRAAAPTPSPAAARVGAGGRTEARGIPAGGPAPVAAPPPPSPASPPPSAFAPPQRDPAAPPTASIPTHPGPPSAWARPPAPRERAIEEPTAGRLPPRWVDGHGWVMHPQDPGPPPRDATWLPGVGYLLADQPPPPPEA